MVRFWNGIWNPEAQPFEIRTIGNHLNPDKLQPFCQKLFEIRTKMSWLWMVWTTALAISKDRPFEYHPIWNPTFKSGFQMVRFQIPTVFKMENINHTCELQTASCFSVLPGWILQLLSSCDPDRWRFLWHSWKFHEFCSFYPQKVHEILQQKM